MFNISSVTQLKLQLKPLTISVVKFLRLMPYDRCYWSLQAITELYLPYHDFFKLCNRWKKSWAIVTITRKPGSSDAAIENNRLDRPVSSLILTIVATIRKKLVERAGKRQSRGSLKFSWSDCENHMERNYTSRPIHRKKKTRLTKESLPKDAVIKV